MSTDELTSKTYIVKCRIKYHERWNNDGPRNALIRLVLLVPEISDQRTAFLKAWLPSVKEQRIEITGYIPHPKIDSPVRCLVRRADERCDKHYLQVMSKGVADDIILKMKEGEVLSLKVSPDSQDEEADDSREAGGSFDIDTRG